MEYKRSTFQLSLQARNVNKSEKNHYNGSYSIVHLKTVWISTTNRKQRGDDKRWEEKRRKKKRRKEKRRK